MDVIQQIIRSLFNKETLKKVKSQFISKNEIEHLNLFDMNFRLFMPTGSNNINLELFVQSRFNTGESEVEIPGLGVRKSLNVVSYFKPIGFYTQHKGIFRTNIEVTILREFEANFMKMIHSKTIDVSVNVANLSLAENAVIAAFSIDAYQNASKYVDCSFNANGLDCDIFISEDGYPQIFLNDKYFLSGPIAAYMLKEQFFIGPISNYDELFSKFRKMSLLTVEKTIKNIQ